MDEVWKKIKEATENGELGQRSKVATTKLNPNARDPTRKVICVYTYDYEDEEDVRRVREKLRGLGFINKIAYKADEDTMAGKYSTTVKGRISKYYY